MSELVSWAHVLGDPREDPEVDAESIGRIAVMSDRLTAAAVCSGRAQRVQTIASSQARIATQWADLGSARERRPHLIAGASGLTGLAIGAATLVPRLVPYEYATAATALGLVMMAAPACLALHSARRAKPLPETDLAVLAGRFRSIAMFGDRLTKIVEKLRGRDGLESPHQQCLDLLLLDLEREVEEAGKTMRGKDGTGRSLRRNERIVPRHRKVVVRSADGRRLHGTIADLSISGVALTECLPRLAFGHEVTIGSRPAKVARVWEQGIAFTFKTPLDVSAFDENVVL